MKKDFFKIVLVLSVIALISGIMLGVVNELTKIDEEQAILDAVSSEFSYVTNLESIGLDTINFSAEQNSAIEKIGRIEKAFKSESTYIILAYGKGAFSNEVGLLIAIQEQKIIDIIAYDSGETPGLGSKALEEDYIGQFKNVDISNFDNYQLSNDSSGKVYRFFTPALDKPSESVEGKDDGRITAITGATKTSTAVVNAVNSAIICYNAIGGYNG